MTLNDIDTGQSFNEDFCIALEYHLGRMFKNSDDENLRKLWCDGISPVPMPIYQLSKKSVNDTRQIRTRAWIGENGQDEYEMTIKFGKYSLRRYAKGTSLIDCLPSEDQMYWLTIDLRNKTIEVTLR